MTATGIALTDGEARETAKLVATIIKNDGTPNISEIAKRLGINRSTLRHRIKQIESGKYPGVAIDKVVISEQIEDEKDLQITRLKDELRKVKKQVSDEKRDQLDAEAIQVILGKIKDAPKDPPNWVLKAPSIHSKSEEVPVTVWSDWHFGEVVNAEEVNNVNEYNSAIAEERIKTLVERTLDICKNHGPKKYPGMVINLLGDFISGGLHPELLRTDDASRIPATIRVIDILITALDTMVGEMGKLYIPCASGNHGRNTAKPEYKGYVHHNFDWLIYEMLRRHYANDNRFQFDNPLANQVYYRVYGTRFLAMHGDMIGARGGDGIIGSIGPIMRGEFKTRRQAGAIDQDYDYLLMGHYHQKLWLPNAIVAGSIKGYDEYVKNSLRAMPSEPSQPLFFVHPERGITSKWDVIVDNMGQDNGGGEWVTWKE